MYYTIRKYAKDFNKFGYMRVGIFRIEIHEGILVDNKLGISCRDLARKPIVNHHTRVFFAVYSQTSTINIAYTGRMLYIPYIHNMRVLHEYRD